MGKSCEKFTRERRGAESNRGKLKNVSVIELCREMKEILWV